MILTLALVAGVFCVSIAIIRSLGRAQDYLRDVNEPGPKGWHP